MTKPRKRTTVVALDAKGVKPDTLDIAVALDAKGAPPGEFRIFSKGEIKTRKGTFLFDEAASLAVMKNAGEFGAEYPLDYGHAMLGGGLFGHADPAEGNKAAGWFKPELRAGELWATDVTWTPRAAKMLADREFRYVSPAFNAKEVELSAGQKGRRIEELINVALTNVPATKGLKPLVLDGTQTDDPGTSPETERDMTMIALATLAALTGHATSATEGEILGGIKEQRALLDDIGKATGKEKPKEAVGVVLAWADKVKAYDEQTTKLAKLETDLRQAEVTKRVNDMIDAKKITPARREFAVKLGMRDPEMFEAFLLEHKEPIVGGEGEQPKPAPVERETTRLDAVSDEYLAAAGVKREDYEKAQKLLRQQGVI